MDSAVAVNGLISDLPMLRKFAVLPVMCNKCAKNIWLRFFYGIPFWARFRAWGFRGIFKNDTRCLKCQKKEEAGNSVPSAAPE